MKIVFEVHFKKKDDFIEEDFLKVISIKYGYIVQIYGN